MADDRKIPARVRMNNDPVLGCIYVMLAAFVTGLVCGGIAGLLFADWLR